MGAMKIYTKTGDDGTTGLFGNQRVPKDALRVEVYGTIDEANSVLGLALAAGAPGELARVLLDLQARLFDLGADLATPRSDRPDPTYLTRIDPAHVETLERLIDRFEAELPPLSNFILPGGNADRGAPAPCAHGRAPRRARPGRARPRENDWASRCPCSSTGCRICCSCSRAGPTARPASRTCPGGRAPTSPRTEQAW